MPNWCNNTLRVFGSDEDVRRFKEQAAGCSPWTQSNESEQNLLNFHSLVPIPPEILAAGYNDAGYNWEREQWGCKWGACETQLVDEWEDRVGFVGDYAETKDFPGCDATRIYDICAYEPKRDGETFPDGWTNISLQVREMMSTEFGIRYAGTGWLEIVENKGTKAVPPMAPDLVIGSKG
jgi:hypothetical protein